MSNSKYVPLTEIIVTGTINVSVPIEFIADKSNLRKLIKRYNLDRDATIEDVAKTIVLEGIRKGLDEMDYRQSEASDVSEEDLEVDIQ